MSIKLFKRFVGQLYPATIGLSFKSSGSSKVIYSEFGIVIAVAISSDL